MLPWRILPSQNHNRPTASRTRATSFTAELSSWDLYVNEREEARPGKQTAFIVPKRSPNLKKASASVPELLWAAVDVDERGDGVVLHLTDISLKRNGQRTNRSIAIRLFETRIIEPLRER